MLFIDKFISLVPLAKNDKKKEPLLLKYGAIEADIPANTLFTEPTFSVEPPMGGPPGPSPRMKRSPPRMNSRPDISMARGNDRAEFNDAENMESNFASVNEKRKEMRGPSSGGGDLRDILAGLKTKKINIKESKSPGSTISVSELDEMNKTDMKRPKKSRRKPKSERNTVSLNL